MLEKPSQKEMLLHGMNTEGIAGLVEYIIDGERDEFGEFLKKSYDLKIFGPITRKGSSQRGNRYAFLYNSKDIKTVGDFLEYVMPEYNENSKNPVLCAYDLWINKRYENSFSFEMKLSRKLRLTAIEPSRIIHP